MNGTQKCPVCGEDMEKGFFTLPNNTIWYPGEKQKGLVKGQVWLVGRMSLFGKQVEGFVCKKDKVAIFQYPE